MFLCMQILLVISKPYLLASPPSTIHISYLPTRDSKILHPQSIVFFISLGCPLFPQHHSTFLCLYYHLFRPLFKNWQPILHPYWHPLYHGFFLLSLPSLLLSPHVLRNPFRHTSPFLLTFHHPQPPPRSPFSSFQLPLWDLKKPSGHPLRHAILFSPTLLSPLGLVKGRQRSTSTQRQSHPLGVRLGCGSRRCLDISPHLHPSLPPSVQKSHPPGSPSLDDHFWSL